MPDAEALYDVREQTGDPEHASVDDVVDLVVERAQNPRDDHEDAHFDAVMAAVVDRYGTEPVRTVIHRVLVDRYPFRTATNGLEMRNVDLSMTGRDDDFEELRPLGEASRTPDHQLHDHSTAAPRRQRRALVETGYPEHPTNEEAECRSCGAPIPASQTKCRFCLTNHLGETDSVRTETAQEATLVGIVFAIVESSTFYGAVAKGAAAGNLLVSSETQEGITEHRPIYDLSEGPASQLVDQWPSLPDATKVTSEAGEQLLTAIQDRMNGQEHSTFAGA